MRAVSSRRSPFSRLSSFFHSGISTAIILALALQPMMTDLARAQEVVIDPSGNVGFAPTLQRTTRPQVVDIARPNQGGVSHNQFTRFDVTPSGVVLNNSTGAVATQVAGTIAGNANLAGNTASTIVNEVRGTGTTTLSGAVEVAGQRAQVIIANPNGLTCSGCSFINAGTATLTTGVPVVSGGTVALNVSQGTVTVGRGGLNGAATGVETVNLQGRFIVVDGRLTAANEVALRAGATTTAPSGATREFAVDATSFGAMEAGRITIVGNELGFGVRTSGALQAGAQGVSVTTPGNVTVRSANAGGAVAVTSTQGTATIERDVASTAGAVTVAGRTGVAIAADAGVFGQTGVSFASSNGGVAVGGQIQSGATITATASGGGLSFTGYGFAGGNVTLTARNDLSLDGATIIANRLAASSTAGNAALAFSALFTGGDVTLTTRDFALGRDVVVEGNTATAASRLAVTATGVFRNGADLRGIDTSRITFAGAIINEASGIIDAAKLSLAAGRTVTNRGTIADDGAVTLSAAAFTNEITGVVIGNAVTLTTTGVLRNDGLVSATGDTRLTAGTDLSQTGVLQSNNAILAGRTIVLRGASDIRARSSVQLTATTSLNQAGTVGTPGTVVITTPSFVNSGSITGETSLRATDATTIANSGTLVSALVIQLGTSSTIANTGTIASFGRVTLAGVGGIDNRGAIQADTILTTTGARLSNIGEASVIRAKTGAINSNAIVNDGRILLIDSFTRRANIDTFTNTGTFASQGSIEISGRTTTSTASIGGNSAIIAGLRADTTNQTLIAGQTVNLGFNSLTVNGQIGASSTVTLTGTAALAINGNVQSNTAGVVLSGPVMTIGSAGRVYSKTLTSLAASTSFRNDGQILAGNDLRVMAGFNTFDNRGGISTGTSTGLVIAGAFINTGVFATQGNLNINAGSISTTGALQTSGGTGLISAGALTIGGSAIAQGSLALTGTVVTTLDNARISATLMNVTGTSFLNAGDASLTSTSRSTWTLSGALTQRGLTYATGEIRATAGSASLDTSSLLASNAALLLTTTGATVIRGARVNAAAITLSGQSIASEAASAIIAQGNLTATATTTASLLGETISGGTLAVTGASVALGGRAYGANLRLTSTGTTVTTSGASYASNELRVNAATTYTNSGLTEAANLIDIDAAAVTNAAAGQIASTRVLVDATGAVSNVGQIQGARDITVTAGSLSNTGTLIAGSLGITTSGAFINSGTIDVFGLFGKSGAATNSGTIDAETYFGLEAASLSNTGAILSKGHVFANATGAISQTTTGRIVARTVDLQSASVSNAGILQASEILSATTRTGVLANVAGGRIYGKTIALSAGTDMTNAGIIGQVGASLPVADLVQIRTGTETTATTARLTNTGTIRANDIGLRSTGVVTNGLGATIQATRVVDVLVTNGGIVNQGMLRGNDIDVDASGEFDSQGTTLATATVRVRASNVRNRIVSASAARIQGDIISLDARTGYLASDGTIAGTTATGLRARVGSLTSPGSITGRDISLIADASGVWITSNLSAANAIYAEGNTVSLSGTVAATNAITLVSTSFDVILGKTASTKTLIVEANRNLSAVAGSLRGTELVQVRANDIIRTDTTVTNRKLGVVTGTLKDLVVELRTGTFGTLTTADNSGYELAAITASGSVSLNALAGNMYLRGTINAARDLVLKSKGELFLRSATLTATRTLQLNSDARVKNEGTVTLNPGTSLEILQGSGWFYTDEWLTTTNINYNLTAFAKRIVVNSDHRFVNRDVSFRASENIVQRDHVISARNVAYSADNDILIEFDGFDWRSDNPGASNTSDWWNVPNAGLRGHTVISQNALSLYAGNDIHLISGRLSASTDLELTAGRNILSEPFYLESYEDSRPINIGWGFDPLYRAILPGHTASKVQLTELRAYENVLTAGRDIKILAGGNIDLIGTVLTATSGDISIHSHAGTITLAAAPGFWLYNHQTSTTRRSWFGAKKTTTTVTLDAYEDLYKPVTMTANNGDISIVSAGARSGDRSTIISAGSVISAQNLRISTRNAANATTTGGSISLGTYAEVSRSSTQSRSKSSFVGITYRDRTNSSARTATFNSGNDLLADDILTINSGNNLTINAGTIAARLVNISAVGNINILAAINGERLDRYTQTQNLVTITTIQEGYDRETAALPQITSPNPVNFTIGGSAHIGAAPALSLNTQLLSIIGTRQFDVNLNPLHTTTARNAAATAATQVSGRYTRDFTLPGAAEGAQFRYLDTLVGEFGATYSQIVLRDQTWYDKQVQLTPAFQALLTIAVSSATGGAGLGLTALQQSVANSLITGGIRGAITGNLDAGTLLRDAVFAGATTYVSGLINSRFELGTSLGLSDASPFASGLGAQFAPAAIVNRLGAQIVNTSVSNVITGRPVFEGLDNLGRTFLVTETLGVVQFGIGGLGNGNQTWEGSLPHILLHGGAGCVALMALDGTCGSGFFAGASQGVLAGSSLTNAQKEALAPFVGGFAGFLFAEGQAVGVNFGSTVAVSGLANNYLHHDEARRKADINIRLEQCRTGANCSAAERTALQAELQELITLDAARQAYVGYVCQARLSAACREAYADIERAVQSYVGTRDGFNELWADNQTAGQIRGSLMGSPAWDPAAFGFGVVGGVLVVTNGVAFAAAVRQASAICAQNLTCTGAVVSQIIGAEVAAEFAGGSIVIRSAGRTLGTVDIPGMIPTVGSPRSATMLADGTIRYTTDAGRVIIVDDAFTIRYLTGTGGRWGTNETRLLNYEIARQLNSRTGFRVTGGGGMGSEEYIPPICQNSGSTAGCSFPDISGTFNGNPVYVQTVTTTSAGVPTASEAAAILRIQTQVPGAIVIAVPKGASATTVTGILNGALQ